MSRVRVTLVLGAALVSAPAASEDADLPAWLEPYRADAERIVAAATADRAAWERIAELTDTFGHRFSGSEALEAALAWSAERMREDGLENVRLQPVKVPQWVRGRESAAIVEPFPSELVMLGLGGSVGTPPEGIEAELLAVASFEELEAEAEAARGRIVLFNVPFTTYGETVRYRLSGASRAARHGAVAMLLRSVGPIGLRTPHTGALGYEADAPRIPAAALPVEDAQRLQRMLDRGQKVRVRLRMEAHERPEADSSNLLAELRGRERPDEIVVLGGHIDSWDVGTGAMDDAAGCVVAWEAVRLLKRLGLRPRRTLRVVFWTNEENGLGGARAYAEAHAGELGRHVAAIEADFGAFRPTGFGFTGTDRARADVADVARLLAPIDADRIGPSGVAADLGPLVRAARVPALSLDTDGPYFVYHHTPADTVERLDPDEVAACVAAMAVMAYVLADMPEPLEREPPPS